MLLHLPWPAVEVQRLLEIPLYLQQLRRRGGGHRPWRGGCGRASAQRWCPRRGGCGRAAVAGRPWRGGCGGVAMAGRPWRGRRGGVDVAVTGWPLP